MPGLESKIKTLPRITKPHVAALKKLGIATVRDLLFYFPYRYLDFSKLTTIKQLKAGENVSLQVTVKDISSRFSFRSHMSMAEAVVSDGTGLLKIVWFNQAYLAKSLHAGDQLFLAGAADYYNAGLQLTNPLYEKVSDFPVHTARLVPVYHLTANLYPKTLRNFIAGILPLASETEESLPAEIVQEQHLLNIKKTIRYSHFPESLSQVEEAKKRLAFEEIFINQLAAQQYKLKLRQRKSYAIAFNQQLVKTFVDSLPFELTAGQKKATWEILQDLEKDIPMNRLLEADVGSGKTLVALIAALEAVFQGLQVAFLAPTEILAKQHFAIAQKFFECSPVPSRATSARPDSARLAAEESRDLPNNRSLDSSSDAFGFVRDGMLSKIPTYLLTNNFAESSGGEITKKELQKLISSNAPGLFIGTHALLSQKVTFKNLALVIIDEQHRFGVEQRADLINRQSIVPHLLSLTATPIPRTLQLAMYGELEISQIKSRPLNRKPIATKLVTPLERAKAYDFLKEQIKQGRQIFVVTPLIEENDALGVKAAKTEFLALQKIFSGFSVGLLHGRMKSADKEQAMTDFLANKIQMLVATSVVEVGVDVPNASVMVIEGAERFGLAQLHQFRGRVGRAEHQSYCFLFTEKDDPEILNRLQDFTKTQDGFALAELDLKQRGFGEIYGSTQSGWNFKYFNPSYVSLITPARQEALSLLTEDIELKKYPSLQKQIEGKVVHFE